MWFQFIGIKKDWIEISLSSKEISVFFFLSSKKLFYLTIKIGFGMKYVSDDNLNDNTESCTTRDIIYRRRLIDQWE